MPQQILLRRGTAAAWTSANPTLGQGELGLETDTGQFKVGDGATAWTSLAYGGLSGVVAATAPVTYNSTTKTVALDPIGTANISDGAVTNAKLANSSITLNGTAVALGGSATTGDVTLTGTQTLTNKTVSAPVITFDTNTQTASYQLVLSDQSKNVEMNVATANNLTVPPNSTVAFPIGTQILVTQYGAGQTTLVAGAGVTIRSNGAKLKLQGQYAQASLIKRATDEWVVSGNLVA